jgi:hypothetical protein
MSNKERAELLAALAMLSGSIGFAAAHAAEGAIPDTFSASAPARVSEANANLSAVGSGADGSARALTSVRSDAQASQEATGGLFLAVADKVVGRGPIDAYGDLPENSLSSGHLLGLSSTGYFFGDAGDRLVAIGAKTFNFDCSFMYELPCGLRQPGHPTHTER